MKKLANLLTTVTILFLGLKLTAQANCYELVWSDEFNGTTLNTNIWNIEVNDFGGGNNELQYYTDRQENLRIENGNLVIEARKENYLTRNYTSARITTQNKISFQYGRIEARMKLPYGKGIWPAFWMLGESISSVGWPNCGEIDIMELVGGGTNDSKVHCTLHWGPVTNGNHPMYGTSYTLPSGKFADDYHIFAVEWDEKTIRGYCDNTQYYVIDISKTGLEAFHNPFFIILNLAVGGNWPGSPDATTVFPQKMFVDYVRVYKKTSQFKIEGKKEVVENEKNIQYKIVNYSSNFQYKWVLPSSITKVSESEGVLTVNWGCQPDTLRLWVKNHCDSSLYIIPVKIKKPVIKGKVWVDEGATGLKYTVDSLPNATFNWSSSQLQLVGNTHHSEVIVNALQEGYLKVEVTTSCNIYIDSLLIRFGDGQLPYPDASKPHDIPGTIVAANFDSGGEGVAYHDLDKGNKGNTYRLNEDVDIEAYDNSYTIGWFDNSEWVEYTVNVLKTATYKANFRVASQLSTGSFSIYVDGNLVAEKVKVPNTGSWNTFTTLTVYNLDLTEGKHVIRIHSHGGFNLGKITFIDATETESISIQKINLYPNPASNIAWIEFTDKWNSSYARIYASDGSLRKVIPITSSLQKINLENLSTGLYYIHIQMKNQHISLPLLIK